MELTPQDIITAKNDVIEALTNELLKARAEVSVLRRALKGDSHLTPVEEAKEESVASSDG